MILDTITARKEDHNLLLHMFLQKREQQQEPSVAWAYDVSLRECRHGGGFFFVVDVDVEGAGAEGDACEVGDFGGLGGGEEHGLAVFWGWVEGRLRSV